MRKQFSRLELFLLQRQNRTRFRKKSTSFSIHFLNHFSPQSKEVIGVVSDKLGKLNRFWAVEIIPFNKNWKQGEHNIKADVSVQMHANLSHRNNIHMPWVYEPEVYKTRKVTCPVTSRSASSAGECSSFSVVFERKIRYLYSALELRFNFVGSSGIKLGDVGIEMVSGTRGYGQFDLAYTILFTIGSIVALVAYIVAIFDKIKTRTATFEQMFTLVLAVGVIFYDNPFFVIEYIGGSIVTFNIFDSLFKNVFIMLLLAYWLLTSERFASADSEKKSSRQKFLDLSSPLHVAKFALALLYFVLSFITTTWTSIRERNDPINGSSISYPGVLVFYIFTVLTIVGVIGWVLFMTVKSIPYVTSSQMVFTRFLFYAIPSFIVAFSLFIGSISGSFGGITRSRIFLKTNNYIFFRLIIYILYIAMEIAFFTALYNTYVYILIYGYWPSGFRFGCKYISFF